MLSLNQGLTPKLDPIGTQNAILFNLKAKEREAASVLNSVLKQDLAEEGESVSPLSSSAQEGNATQGSHSLNSLAIGLGASSSLASQKLIEAFVELSKDYLQQQKNQTLVGGAGASASAQAQYTQLQQAAQMAEKDGQGLIASGTTSIGAGVINIGAQAGSYALKTNPLNKQAANANDAATQIRGMKLSDPVIVDKAANGGAAPAPNNAFKERFVNEGPGAFQYGIDKLNENEPQPQDDLEQKAAIEKANKAKESFGSQIDRHTQTLNTLSQIGNTLAQGVGSTAQGSFTQQKQALYEKQAQVEAAKVAFDFMSNTASGLTGQLNQAYASAFQEVKSTLDNLDNSLFQMDSARA